jgi:hypothetical protein
MQCLYKGDILHGLTSDLCYIQVNATIVHVECSIQRDKKFIMNLAEKLYIYVI